MPIAMPALMLDMSTLVALTDPRNEAFAFRRGDLHLREMVTVYLGTAQ